MLFSELIRRIGEAGGEVLGVLPAGGLERPPEGGTANDPEVRRICEDSRKVQAGDLFVARRGTKANGAKFVAEAVAKGAVAVVSEEPSPSPGIAIPGLEGVAWARVGDANLAGALLAHELAGRPTAPPHGMTMIAVTGTKGKTTVAYLLRSVLRAAGKKVGMIGTVEIDDGVKVAPAEMTTPGAVELVEMFCRMRENGVEYCVMEVSSHALHQERVAGIDWAVAIFTNLTGDHLDYHKTMEEYAAAKARLFEGLKEGAFAIINVDDPWAEMMQRSCKARVIPFCVVDRGEYAWTPTGLPALPERVPPGGFAGHIWQMTSREMVMTVGCDARTLGHTLRGQSFATPLVGKHNCYNATSVYAAATVLGALRWCKDLQINENVTRVWNTATGAPGRLQRVAGGHPFDVFVDYAHTHDALENVLTALRTVMGKDNRSRDRQGATGLAATVKGSLPDGRGSDNCGLDGAKLICVFGCGGDRDRTKRPKMGAVAEKLADVVIVTSDNPRTEEPGAIIEEICAGFSAGWKSSGKIMVEPDRRVAISRAIAMAEKGDVVLLAGKGHENYQIVGTTKHHFDDVEEAVAAMAERRKHEDTKPPPRRTTKT